MSNPQSKESPADSDGETESPERYAVVFFPDKADDDPPGYDKEHAELLRKRLLADGFHDHAVSVQQMPLSANQEPPVDREESVSSTDRSEAERAVVNARGLLSDFEDVDTEIRYGAIKHALEELQNARRALPDDY